MKQPYAEPATVTETAVAENRPKVLFLVEGNTDIRFVTGLSQVSSLTIAVPGRAYAESGLKERIQASGIRLSVAEVPGGRLRFQAASLRYLLRHASEFDLILCQELLRGALNAGIAGALTHTPVIAYMCIPPLEYFRCRYERRQSGWLKHAVGSAVIRSLMLVNGRLATRCVALGPYLMDIAAKYCPRTVHGLYYGVDTAYFHPVEESEKLRLRVRLGLPRDAFLVFYSSRVTHEKDPETALQAVSIARSLGLNAALLNLSGGHGDFLRLAERIAGPQANEWVLARPAAHPSKELAEYYQSADCLVQASLSEGLGLSPLEAMSCGTPAVCTDVGGLGANLKGFARLTAPRDPVAMANEILWVAENREASRAQALAGRDFVMQNWTRQRALDELSDVFEDVRRLRH